METPAPEYIPSHLEHTSDLAAVLLEKKKYVEQTTKWALDSIFAQVTHQDTLYMAEIQETTINRDLLEQALAHEPRERYQGKEETLWTDEVDYVVYESSET